MQTAINFIGHAASDPALDAFMVTQVGMQQKVTFKTSTVHDQTDAIELRFKSKSSYQSFYGTPRSDGAFILEMVTRENPKYQQESRATAAPLPLGLHLEMTQEAIIAVLGEPSSSQDMEGGTFLFYDGLMPARRVMIKLHGTHGDIELFRVVARRQGIRKPGARVLLSIPDMLAINAAKSTSAAANTLTPVLLAALGKDHDDPKLRAAFAEFSLHTWPETSASKDKHGSDNDNMVEYLQHGFSLNFMPAGQYSPSHNEWEAKSDFVVFEISFYLRDGEGEGDYRAFTDKAPFYLSANMSADVVQQYLGAPQASRRLYDRRVDKYLVREYAVNAFFNDDDGGLERIVVHKQTVYDYGRLRPDRTIDSKHMIAALGRKATDPKTLELINQGTEATISAANIIGSGVHHDDEHPEQYIRKHGLAFMAEPGKAIGKTLLNRNTPFLTRVDFRRAGYFDSAGYKGLLPFGLTFADSPETILSKLPVTPDKVTESEESTGCIDFNHNGLYYQIEYSRIYWQMLRMCVRLIRGDED